MKYIQYLCCGMALFALSCSSSSDDKTSGGGSDKALTFKVMSFNIRSSNTTDTGVKAWSVRRKPCVNMIVETAPDVIGMQESLTDQRTYLKTMLPAYTQLEVPNSGTTTSGGNTTILYLKEKFSQLSWGYFYLSNTPDTPSLPWSSTDTTKQIAIWVRLIESTTGKIFIFCTTQLPANDTAADNEARLNSVNLIVTKMKKVAGDSTPLLIVGDMNCSYDTGDTKREALAPFYTWMSAARTSTPTTDTTFSFNNFGSGASTPIWNLDHIFYRMTTAVEFHTINGADYGVTYISNHYPITLTAKI